MKDSKLALVFFGLLLAVSPFASAENADEDAETVLLRRLRRERLRVGYDSEARRMVQTCVVAKEAEAVRTDPAALLKMRLDAFLCAECMARGSVMRSLTNVTDIHAEAAVFSENCAAMSGTAVESSVGSSFYPYGCQVVASAETLQDGVLEVAVALGWTPETEKGIRWALTASPDDFDPLPEPREPSPEWTIWAEQQDFANSAGFRSFVDSEGFWRFAGIGLADVEGKSGAALLAAERRARSDATANLAYALFGNVEASRRMVKFWAKEESGGKTESKIETFVSETMRKSAKAHMKDAEVYTTTVVHPLTGRKLFVSVAGIEPRDLAEMNLLGNANGGVRRRENPERPEYPSGADRPNRPDHSFRPASNRPDHSFRPASNRPEHP